MTPTSGRAPARTSRFHITVNPITCDGHGLCAELLPELIALDDWGYPIVVQKEVPRHLDALAKKARNLCPTLAFLLEGA